MGGYVMVAMKMNFVGHFLEINYIRTPFNLIYFLNYENATPE